MLKHSGELPIHRGEHLQNPHLAEGEAQCAVELARATEEEKQSQLKRLRQFQRAHPPRPRPPQAPARGGPGRRQRLSELMDTVRCAPWADHQGALYVGGKYRRACRPNAIFTPPASGQPAGGFRLGLAAGRAAYNKKHR